MIIWSPFILDELAGLRDSAPPTIDNDRTSRELANKTGFITTLAGPSHPDGSAWTDIRYFGITHDATTDVAIEFVKYALGQGYSHILSIAPEGKIPVRRGDKTDPERFIRQWASLPVGVDRKAPLTELYSKDVIENLVAGLEKGSRWGIKEGQLSLASKIINSQVFNRLMREYIDDERSLEDTISLLREELNKIKRRHP